MNSLSSFGLPLIRLRAYNRIDTRLSVRYNLEGGNNKVDWATTQNAMDNLMNIIKAESTLKRVEIIIRVIGQIIIEYSIEIVCLSRSQVIEKVGYRFIFMPEV